ncbi:MAG TPA: hypothetical protein VMO47_03940 [Rhodothermales bacterium]|nr:hypothetical protein [Rhodothermales bacterium]
MEKFSNLIDSIWSEYRRYKAVAESAIAQLSDQELVLTESP